MKKSARNLYQMHTMSTTSIIQNQRLSEEADLQLDYSCFALQAPRTDLGQFTDDRHPALQAGAGGDEQTQGEDVRQPLHPLDEDQDQLEQEKFLG